MGPSHLARKPNQKAGMHCEWISGEHLEREPGHLLVVLLGIERGDSSLEPVAELALPRDSGGCQRGHRSCHLRSSSRIICGYTIR